MKRSEPEPGCATSGVPTPSCLVRTIALGGVLFWLAAALGGFWMVIDDLRIRDELFDGLGSYIGIMVILICLVLCIPWFITRRTQSMTWFWISIVTSVAALIYAALSVS